MTDASVRARRICTILAVLALAGCAAGEEGASRSAEPTRVMALADQDADDVVTLEEWDARGDELFSEIDRGGDGQLDLQELQDAFEILDQDDNNVLDAREAPTVIDYADTNDDGLVTRTEFDSTDWAQYPIDLNSDGVVSPREFRQGRRETFRDFDGDRDDRLNALELDNSSRFKILSF